MSKQSCKHGTHTHTHANAKKRETNRLFLTSFAFSIIFLIYCYTRFVFSFLSSSLCLALSRFNGVFLIGTFIQRAYEQRTHTIESNVILLLLLLPACVCARRFHYHLQPCFKSILAPFTLDSMALLMLDSTSAARRAFTIPHTHT